MMKMTKIFSSARCRPVWPSLRRRRTEALHLLSEVPHHGVMEMRRDAQFNHRETGFHSKDSTRHWSVRPATQN